MSKMFNSKSFMDSLLVYDGKTEKFAADGFRTNFFRYQLVFQLLLVRFRSVLEKGWMDRSPFLSPLMTS